jgi:NADPH-dependent ferric siderophore reductase
MGETPLPRHFVTRVRREPARRKLTVANVERLTPQMQRIRFTSPELHDFSSMAPDDHIKLFLPMSAEQNGGMAGVCVRDYTPRLFDVEQCTLTVDFALHVAGPATTWARSARVGDTLEIGGPRGSNVVADDFDWYLLIGDETALPAIGRRVEELRPDVPVTTVVVVSDHAERQTFATRSTWTACWVSRERPPIEDDALLRAALSDHTFPAGDGYIWIAAEARTARSLRSYMIDTRGHPKAWIKAAGYWVRGEAAAHETVDD